MLPTRNVAATAFGTALLLSAAACARAAETPLELAVGRGATLFRAATFGGNGQTCESCHADGGKTPAQLGNRKLPSLLNAAAIYPRFSAGVGQVVTLEGQIQQCIKGGLAGTPPELGSADLVAIAAYLGSIAKGQLIEIGGAPK